MVEFKAQKTGKSEKRMNRLAELFCWIIMNEPRIMENLWFKLQTLPSLLTLPKCFN